MPAPHGAWIANAEFEATELGLQTVASQTGVCDSRLCSHAIGGDTLDFTPVRQLDQDSARALIAHQRVEAAAQAPARELLLATDCGERSQRGEICGARQGVGRSADAQRGVTRVRFVDANRAPQAVFERAPGRRC